MEKLSSFLLKNIVFQIKDFFELNKFEASNKEILLVPKLYLKNNGDKLSLRCFAMDTNKNILYLPAFGDLTGGYICKKTFKKWAIISEEEIIEI